MTLVIGAAFEVTHRIGGLRESFAGFGDSLLDLGTGAGEQLVGLL